MISPSNDKAEYDDTCQLPHASDEIEGICETIIRLDEDPLKGRGGNKGLI